MGLPPNSPAPPHPQALHMPILYCPLDLYSGDPGRILTALKALVGSANNNWRVFLDGSSCVDSDALTKAEETLFNTKPSSKDHKTLHLLTQILHREPLLSNLALHQQRLDQFDIEKIHEWYQHLQRHSLPANLTTTEWESILQTYLHPPNRNQNQNLNIHQHLREFQISTSLKDCSILLALKRRVSTSSSSSSSSTKAMIEFEGMEFEYTLKVVDVDFKPLHKVPGYFEKDQEILR
ncbi:hypothetical protein HDV05_005153 [Chytridiales sp. JEL 0842]|nr:hypothetical protein HDV05_005153 [Chytridiales sp. JEL 0842]